MIEFPGTEQEVRQLERFLTATEKLPSDDSLDDMRARALKMLAKSIQPTSNPTLKPIFNIPIMILYCMI